MKSRAFAFNGTAYDAFPSGARNRAVGLAAALLRAGHEVTWLAAAGATAAPLVAAELGAPLPADRWREIATDLDPRRPLARLLAGARTLAKLVPRGTDLFVTDYHPVLPRDDVPTALTVHDLRYLVCPAAGDGPRALWFRTAYPATARAAALVTAPTQAAAAECSSHLGVDRTKLVVVPNALGLPWRQAPAAGTTPLHLLLVGASDPRKDPATAFDAMRRAAGAASHAKVLPLVVASRASRTLDQALAKADDLVRRGVLRVVESPDDRTVVSLARDAAALVHPSRYEGFGMTVIEGMSVGLPVLAARCAAVEEVAAGLAQILHPGDVDAWSRALLDASAHRPRGDGGARRRIERARAFSWDAAAAALAGALVHRARRV